MAFTMPSYPLLNAQQASPYADLVKNALQTYGTAVQARYAPQTVQADIFSKEFAPLAQIASSPLALAMLPEQRQQMANLISQLLKQTGAQGGGNQPVGAGLGALFGGQGNQGGLGGQGVTGGGSASTGGEFGAVNQASPQLVNDIAQHGNSAYNPSIPQAGGDLGTGATAKVTAPYQEQVHGAGVSFFDPNTGKFYSQPTESTVAVNQKSIGAIKRVLPQLHEIADESQEFLKPGGMAGTVFSSIAGKLANWGVTDPETIKHFGVDPEKYSRYLKWRGDISQAMDSLMTSFPNLPQSDLSLNTMASIVEPHSGESDKGYASRVMQAAGRLGSQQLPALQQGLMPIQIGGGGQQQPMPNASAQVSPDNSGAEGTVEDTRDINGVHYFKVNGRWFHQ